MAFNPESLVGAYGAQVNAANRARSQQIAQVVSSHRAALAQQKAAERAQIRAQALQAQQIKAYLGQLQQGQQQMLAGYAADRDAALANMSTGVGRQQQIGEQFARATGNIHGSMVSKGLAGSTAEAALHRGIEIDKQRQLAALDDQIRGERGAILDRYGMQSRAYADQAMRQNFQAKMTLADLYGRQGQTAAQFAAQRAGLYGQQAQLLGGIRYLPPDGSLLSLYGQLQGQQTQQGTSALEIQARERMAGQQANIQAQEAYNRYRQTGGIGNPTFNAQGGGVAGYREQMNNNILARYGSDNPFAAFLGSAGATAGGGGGGGGYAAPETAYPGWAPGAQEFAQEVSRGYDWEGNSGLYDVG